MSLQDLINLLDILAWPIITLAIILIFKKHISSLIDRIRELEGPGDLKISLNENKNEIKEILKEGTEKKYAPEEMLERIMQTLDKREIRIVRALFDDPGRAIYSYQNDYYKDALKRLLDKGYVEKRQNGYSLTKEGNNFAKEYFQRVIERINEKD
jgi:16S rRNA C967 or C1407 C5-methylase (RsmB/RsmF family)